jgi:hypothetical protein
MRPLMVLLSAFLLAPAAAYAQDDDGDLLGDDEEEKEDKPTRIDEGDTIETEDDESLDTLDGKDAEDGEDLLGEDVAKDQIGGPGQDNASIYRAFQEKVKDEPPDEELIRWEAYLEKYPNSLFKDRIEKRMEELEQLMYAERIDEGGEERLDADQKEVVFSQGLQLDNINPRDRLQFGFEWGIPNYINLIADYEYAIQRNLSVHGGARHRYTGWRLEMGAKYALVKSVRTQTLVTGLLDLHLNTNPAYPVFRPQVAVGKRFFNKLDAQLQVGTELDTRGQAAPRLIGGANIMYRAADTVGIFLETTAYQQGLSDTLGAQEWKGSYAFNGLNFGIKFFPTISGVDKGDFEANVGASVPYYTDYWMYHYGSIMGQGNLYFD